MKISIENFGIISKASVEVNGITLIAGPNDSGKSTIGKIFYSLIRGFNPEDVIFNSEKNDSIRGTYQQILKLLKDNSKIEFTEFQTTKINKTWTKSVRATLANFEGLQKKRLEKYLNLLENEFKIEFKSSDHKSKEIDIYFRNEFSDEVQSVFSPEGITRILLDDLEGSSIIEFDSITTINKNIETYYTDSFFIESPSIVNSSLEEAILFEERVSRDKNLHLKFALANESQDFFINIKNDDMAGDILNEIATIIGGELIVDDFRGVIYEKSGKDINIDNVALGIKSFGLLQLLIKNRRLNDRTLLIIDEPEIHLHPNWQIQYAKLLVLLSLNFDIPFLLTSHSPYFIEAIKVYSDKYNFSKKTKFYFSQKDGDGLTAKINDVTEDISPILISISEANFKIIEAENG